MFQALDSLDDFARLSLTTKFASAELAGKISLFRSTYAEGMTEGDLCHELGITRLSNATETSTNNEDRKPCDELGRLIYQSINNNPKVHCEGDRVCPKEFLTLISTLIHGNSFERLDFLFDVWDVDRTGSLSRRQVERIVDQGVQSGRYTPEVNSALKETLDARGGQAASQNNIGRAEFQSIFNGLNSTHRISEQRSDGTRKTDDTSPLLGFAIGTLSGMFSILCCHPLDTAKVRIQLREPVPTNPRELYRGMTAPLLSAGGKVGAGFCTKELWCKVFNRTPEGEPMSLSTLSLMGVASGVVVAPIITPVELLKIRQQGATGGGKMPSTFAVMKDVVRNEGPTGMFRGMAVTTMRLTPGWGLYFAGYEWAKRLMEPDTAAYSSGIGKGSVEHKGPSTNTVLNAGGVAGILACMASLPMDVVKTKVQMRLEPNGRTAFRNLMKQQGIQGFFSGIGPFFVRAYFANASLFYASMKLRSGHDQWVVGKSAPLASATTSCDGVDRNIACGAVL